jgi:putative FmdB family regulatory protein
VPEPVGFRVAIRAPGGELMPIYEYRCGGCGHEFTLVLSISEHDKATKQCPKCKSENVEQTMSAVFVKTSRKS